MDPFKLGEKVQIQESTILCGLAHLLCSRLNFAPVFDVKLLVELRHPALVPHHVGHRDQLLPLLLAKLGPVLRHPGNDKLR